MQNNAKQASFFDDTNKPTKLWTKPPKNQESLQDLHVLSGTILHKKGKKTGIWKKRFYVLTEKFVAYTKDEKSQKIIKVMNFDCTRMDLLEKNVEGEKNEMPFGFRFMKNTCVSELYLKEAEIFKKWRSILIYKVIMHTFHEEFEVKKLIGKGSFARVYLATKKEDGKDYAIKAFSKEVLLNSHKGKESLVNEIVIMQKMNHPNCIKLYEVYETKNSIYLVLEMIKGGELIKKIREKFVYKERDVKLLMYNFLQALLHIHDRNVMHRDLKPENILLRDEGNIQDIVIADFGLATFKDAEEILFKRCGTPGFVAPEILIYKEGSEFYDEKCDVFSAGIIFYLLITGKKPFEGKDYKVILKQNKDCAIDFKRQVFDTISKNCLDLMKKMLLPYPQVRISAREALNHPYFEELHKEDPEDENFIWKDVQENLKNYSSYHMSDRARDEGEVTELSSGGSLISRKPILRGNADTFDKLSQNHINSGVILSMDYVPIKKGASKFSEQKDEGNSPSGKSQTKRSGSSHHNNLHKLALMNSYKAEQTVFKPKPNDEMEGLSIPDENSTLSKNLTKANSMEKSLISDEEKH